VRGFTSISEALKPEELREYINEYLTDMSNIIRVKYRGTLDKYIGDAIMAFWGAPMDDPQHARNGVLAALEMQRGVQGAERALRRARLADLQDRVGLNSGTVRGRATWARRCAAPTPRWATR
jgi:adenylate cyclase